jgi:CRP-like cAMP-binding protein
MSDKSYSEKLRNKISSIFGEDPDFVINQRFFHFSRGDIIFNESDEARSLYFIESGLVGIIKTTETGSDYILRLHGEEDFFGYRPFFSDKKYYATAMSIEESTIIRITMISVDQLFQNNNFLKYLLSDLSEKMLVTEKRFTSTFDKDVKARIAEALIFLSTRYPEHRWTKKEIAEFCGSTTSTVIRSMSEFEKLGLIDQTGNKVNIPSIKALLNKCRALDE